MAKKFDVYFPIETWKKVYKKATKYPPVDLAKVGRTLIKKYYIEKLDPEVEGKGRNSYDECHRYTFSMSEELFEKFTKKMALQKDKNKSKIMIQLFEKYFL